MKIKNLKIHEHGNILITEFETKNLSGLNVFPAGMYIEKGLCRVLEQQHEQVGNILVMNDSEAYLLFTDMDILIGAKQNRVVNISTLVKPLSKSNLEVSCIEQHRWDHGKKDFKTSKTVIEPDLRQQKLETICCKSETAYYRNELQHNLWQEVEKKIIMWDEINPTGNYEQYLESTAKNYANIIPPEMEADENCNGIAMFQNGRLQNVEVFGNKVLYRYYFSKIYSHYLKNVKPLKSQLLKEEELIGAIEEEIGMHKFFTPVSGKNGVGELRLINTDLKKGFDLSYLEDRVHGVVMGG